MLIRHIIYSITKAMVETRWLANSTDQIGLFDATDSWLVSSPQNESGQSFKPTAQKETQCENNKASSMARLRRPRQQAQPEAPAQILGIQALLHHGPIATSLGTTPECSHSQQTGDEDDHHGCPVGHEKGVPAMVDDDETPVILGHDSNAAGRAAISNELRHAPAMSLLAEVCAGSRQAVASLRAAMAQVHHFKN